MIAGDRDRVKITDILGDEIFLDVAHHLEGEIDGEDAGILALILLENIGLDGTAHVLQDHGLDFIILLGRGGVAVFLGVFFHLLVDGRVEEHGQHDRRRAVDRHGNRGVGRTQLETAIEHLDIVQGADADAGIAHLAIDVRAAVRIVAIQGYRVERRGEPLGLAVCREQLETPVGACRIAFAGEHARRVLAHAFHGEDAGGEGEIAGQVFASQPAVDLAGVREARQGDLGDFLMGEGLGIKRYANFTATHRVDQLVAGVGRTGGLPFLDQGFAVLIQIGTGLVDLLLEARDQVTGAAVESFSAEGLGRLLQVPDSPERFCLAFRIAVVGPYGFGDLGQVAGAFGGDDDGFGAGLFGGRPWQARCKGDAGFVLNGVQEGMVQGGDAVVIEFGGDGAEHRHVVGRPVENHAVALHLFADITHGVLAATLLEFVDHHEIGEIEHVDLLQLGGRTEIAGHDIHGEIHHVDNMGIPLADAGGFGDDQIIAGGLDQVEHFGQGVGDFGMRAARGNGTHVDPRVADGVHADAIAQKGAAGLAPGGVGADDGDADILEVVKQAQDQFVRQGGLAGTAGAGDADDRHLAIADMVDECFAELGQVAVFLGLGLFQGGDQIGHAQLVVRSQIVKGEVRLIRPGEVHQLDHVVDNSLQAHARTVFRRVYFGHTVGFQLLDLIRHDDAAAAAEHLDVRRAGIA
ncbi:conserved hypothetical protein [Desulfosarcina cetonica]|nr:conserved hypothetical protein [Desulfosarcina cetonica]